jgi:hypothetical protein
MLRSLKQHFSHRINHLGPHHVNPRHCGIHARQSGVAHSLALGTRDAKGRNKVLRERAARPVQPSALPRRFHSNIRERPSASAMAEIPLRKRTREDGRCPARTGDLLLVRQALYQLS